MIRKIEALIEDRKRKQHQLKETLQTLAGLFDKRSIFRHDKKKAAVLFSDLHRDISELITIQDREWDAYSNNHSAVVFKSLEWKIKKLEAEYSLVKNLLLNFVELEQSLQNLIQAAKENISPEVLEKLTEIRSRLSPLQYADFEHRFRGEEAEIKEQLRPYLSYFSDSTDVLDIGCGRGEFLELLAEQKIDAVGIDISDSMIKKAVERGLNNVKKADALEYLVRQRDQSIGGIFSSQVIEHFDARLLQQVIHECFRVLKKHSVIVLETINPLSLFAMANIYYMDAGHRNPLHPEYMRYLLEQSGFDQVDIRYSRPLEEESLETLPPDRENAAIFNTNVDKLNQLLFSSPHYAAVGRKM